MKITQLRTKQFFIKEYPIHSSYSIFPREQNKVSLLDDLKYFLRHLPSKPHRIFQSGHWLLAIEFHPELTLEKIAQSVQDFETEWKLEESPVSITPSRNAKRFKVKGYPVIWDHKKKTIWIFGDKDSPKETLKKGDIHHLNQMRLFLRQNLNSAKISMKLLRRIGEDKPPAVLIHYSESHEGKKIISMSRKFFK